MNSTPLATVAMVTYNSSAYVAQAIESVLCQSHENLELLICDDRSTDNTWEIIQSYNDPRIRAIRNAQNLGEYPNRNQAARLAKGKYLIYIDGDDILYPHGLEFMVRMLDAFPSAAMAMACPWNEKIIYPVEVSPRQIYLSEYLGQGGVAINFAHVLFRTAALQEVNGIDTRYRSGDVWIQLRIGLTGSALLISDGVSWWRRTPGQASEAVLQNHNGWVESLQYRCEFLSHPDCPLTKQEKKLAYTNIYGGFIRMALRYVLKGKIKHGISLLKRAQIPWGRWRATFTPGRYPYMNDVNASQPLHLPLNQNPFSQCERAGQE